MSDSDNTNSTISPSADFKDPGEWHRAFSSTIAAILIVAALVAILGNTMVLTVIIRHRGMRTRTNLFLVNLAVADLFVAVLVMPFSITTMINHGWIFGEGGGTMCQFNGWMNSFCLITSIHTLMYIGVHKYFSIVHPLSKAFQLRTIIFLMCMAWIWAAICSTMNVWGLKIVYKPGTSQCGPNYPDDMVDYIIHAILQLTVMIIPFFTLVFCYTRMFVEIKKHSARLRKNSTVEEEYILATQKKVAVTLFIVLAFFFLMALPYQLYATYATVKKNKVFANFLNPVVYMFLYLNSMVNPIIYAFRSPAFREGYKEILCQTPNYVISDDSISVTEGANNSDFAPRTNRLASLVSTVRRGSVGSVSRLGSALAGADSTQDLSNPELKKLSKITSVPASPSPLSPSDVLASKRAKLQKTHRKSLFDLLKATRQSNAQSVVHRNGDMIIMKGGKIVSVHRRDQSKEKNNLLDRLAKLAKDMSYTESATAPTADGNQNLQVPNRPDIPPISTVNEEESNAEKAVDNVTASREDNCHGVSGAHGKVLETHNGKDLISQNQRPEHDLNTMSRNIKDSNALNTFEDEKLSSRHTNGKVTNVQVPANSSQSASQTLTSAAQGDVKEQTNDNTNSSSGDSRTFDFSPATDSSAPAIFINLDDDNHVTGVIPLSPLTKEHLEQAVKTKESSTDNDLKMSLQHDLSKHRHFERHRDAQNHQPPSRHGRLYAAASAVSRSSEDLTSPGPRLLRLPSLEYLDPPSRLFASSSSTSLRAPSYEAWKAQQAKTSPTTSPSSSPRQRIRSRLHKLHLPSMKRVRQPTAKVNESSTNL